jgi:hypothetical protein
MAILQRLCLIPLLALSLYSIAYSSKSEFDQLGSAPAFHQNIRRSQIRTELGPLLSPGAVIIDAESGNLTAATERWQVFASPSFFAAVEVATELDIIQTVRLF